MLNTKSEQYEPSSVERVKKMLQIQQQTGGKPYYSIIIDGMEMISKVEDLSLFDQYKDFILDSTETLEIHTYQYDKSKLTNKFVFHLKEKPAQAKPIQDIPKPQTLGEVEIQGIVAKHVAQERERWEMESLRKTLEEKQKQLDTAEEYVEQLEDDIEAKKAEDGGSLKATIMEALSVAKEFAPMFTQGKTEAPLAGSPPNNNASDSAASFKAKTESSTPAISEEDQKRLEKAQQRAQQFTAEELSKIDQIIDLMAQEKRLIDFVIDGWKQAGIMEAQKNTNH